MDVADGYEWPVYRTRSLTRLVRESGGTPYLDHLFAHVCAGLHAEGLPIDRATMHVRTLHPLFYGARMLWRPGLTEAEIFPVNHDVLDAPGFRHSPIRALYDGAEAIRQRLDLPSHPGDDDFSIYADLREEGFTDYVALPLTSTDDRRHAVTFATKRAKGFATADLMRVDDLLPILSMTAEIRLNRRIAKNLLNTYVGPRAGERVLSGQITRGSGSTVSAAIWLCDMRSFTAISERWPFDDVIGRLNDYFDAMGGAVERHGGEILKFIGDGMLAIFPLVEDDACLRALRAAVDARTAVMELNTQKYDALGEPLGFGIALHVGDVMYGNIGSATRLDFTVIGPAVNTAARLEGLTKQVGRQILLTGPFAAQVGDQPRKFVPLGHFPLRGVGEPVEVLGLAEQA